MLLLAFIIVSTVRNKVPLHEHYLNGAGAVTFRGWLQQALQ